MPETVKAVSSALVIVACLILLGVMVYLKVDGAGVGAVGVVVTIVAWLTKAPSNPPPAMKAIPFFVAAAAGLFMFGLLACGCGVLSPAVESDLDKLLITIACSEEQEELADPVLNANCQALSGSTSPLTAEQRATIMSHSAKARATSRTGSKPDAGATDGGAT